MSRLRFLLPLLSLTVVASSPAKAIIFDDGQVYVIDAANSFPFESVDVRNGPGVSTTTLELVDGGDIGSFVDGNLDVSEASVALPRA